MATKQGGQQTTVIFPHGTKSQPWPSCSWSSCWASSHAWGWNNKKGWTGWTKKSGRLKKYGSHEQSFNRIPYLLGGGILGPVSHKMPENVLVDHLCSFYITFNCAKIQVHIPQKTLSHTNCICPGICGIRGSRVGHLLSNVPQWKHQKHTNKQKKRVCMATTCQTTFTTSDSSKLCKLCAFPMSKACGTAISVSP